MAGTLLPVVTDPPTQAAQVSADAAAASEAAAAASAASALSSETNAASSANNAATSEVNSLASETSAASSATAAATSESNAAASETSSATSATNAALSETNAATSETNAALSETNAATSETNAATSASNAAASESNALTGATNAATSETNAAASASSAATSASNASISEVNSSNNNQSALTAANNAAISEANSQTFSNNSAASATNAATSETNAATSEANAAASATSAATSATDAANSAALFGAGGIGNINDPLVQIPMRRANDATRLSGVETFTRASTGTYIDPTDGLLKTAAIDEQRHERMADGGVGRLLEGTSTNLCLYSEDQTNGVYSGTAGVTMSGVVAAVSDASTTAISYITQYVTIPADTITRTQSIHIPKTSASPSVFSRIDFVQLGGVSQAHTCWFDSFNGTLSSDSSANVKVKDAGIYWRLEGAITNNGGNTSMKINYYPASRASLNGADDVTLTGTGYCAMWQYEALPFASSYIPTTGTAVTRAADRYSIPMSGNIVNGASSIVLDFIAGEVLAAHRCLFSNYTAAATTAGITDCVLLTGTRNIGLWYNGSSLGVVVTAVPDDNLPHRLSISLSNNGTLKVFLDGVLTSTKTGVPTSAKPTNSSLGLGGKIDGDIPLYGNISNFRVYDRALTDAEIGAA